MFGVSVAIDFLKENREQHVPDPFDHSRHLIKLFSSSYLTGNSKGTSFLYGSIGLSFYLPK